MTCRLNVRVAGAISGAARFAPKNEAIILYPRQAVITNSPVLPINLQPQRALLRGITSVAASRWRCDTNVHASLICKRRFARASDGATQNSETTAPAWIDNTERGLSIPADLPGNYTVVKSHGDTNTASLESGSSSSPTDVHERLALWIEALLQPQDTRTDVDAIEIADGVRVEKIGSIADRKLCLQVVICRAEKGNAMNSNILTNLAHTFNAIGTIKNVQSVVLSGNVVTGRKHVFCAGADVTEMSKLGNRDEAQHFIRKISALCTAIRNVHAPVVAAIDGPCIGAGLEVAASCDMRVATDSSIFSMPEVVLGIPSVVEARLLCDIVGWGRARHLMLTGCTWSANEAYEAGLITSRFDNAEDLWRWTQDFMASCVRSLGVHQVQKDLMKQWENISIDDGIEISVGVFGNRFVSPHGEEVRQLMAKRLRPKGDSAGTHTPKTSINDSDK